MYERILVPLDGSDPAEIVIPYVEEIASKFNSEIFLVSVSEQSAADMDHLYLAYLEKILKQVQRRLEDFGVKAKVHTGFLVGKPAEEILRQADEKKIDLIAMASRGASGRGPWLLGNIAAKVLRAATKPVLLVRSATTRQKNLVKKILVPLDGSKTGEAAIDRAGDLAHALGADVVLLQVVEPITVVPGFDSVAPQVTPISQESIEASAMAYLNGMANQLRDKKVETSVVVGWVLRQDKSLTMPKLRESI